MGRNGSGSVSKDEPSIPPMISCQLSPTPPPPPQVGDEGTLTACQPLLPSPRFPTLSWSNRRILRCPIPSVRSTLHSTYTIEYDKCGGAASTFSRTAATTTASAGVHQLAAASTTQSLLLLPQERDLIGTTRHRGRRGGERMLCIIGPVVRSEETRYRHSIIRKSVLPCFFKFEDIKISYSLVFASTSKSFASKYLFSLGPLARKSEHRSAFVSCPTLRRIRWQRMSMSSSLEMSRISSIRRSFCSRISRGALCRGCINNRDTHV